MFSGWDPAEFVEESPVVEPVDPFQGGQLQVVEAPPRPQVADEFGLVEADDRFGQGVVLGVASGSDRRDNPVLGEAFGVSDR